MDWYHGPTLMAHLETVDVAPDPGARAFRMPVQWVNDLDPDFHGFAGTVTGGSVRKGDRLTALPGGTSTTVERIVTFDGDLDEAHAGDAVTLVLADKIDGSRGDVFCDPDGKAEISDQLAAHVVWITGPREADSLGDNSARCSQCRFSLMIVNPGHTTGPRALSTCQYSSS